MSRRVAFGDDLMLRVSSATAALVSAAVFVMFAVFGGTRVRNSIQRILFPVVSPLNACFGVGQGTGKSCRIWR